jgi:hypothetical protein
MRLERPSKSLSFEANRKTDAFFSRWICREADFGERSLSAKNGVQDKKGRAEHDCLLKDARTKKQWIACGINHICINGPNLPARVHQNRKGRVVSSAKRKIVGGVVGER